MTGKREPTGIPGGFGTVSTFGSLDGWTLAEVDEYLGSHPELERRSITEGGYRRYQFKDGSEVWIRPNGQIIRIPFPIYDADGNPFRGLRIGIASGTVMYSGAWHNLPRNGQEWVVIDDSTN